MDDKMKAIQALENKYGLIPFGMGLSQLVDVGIRRLSDSAAVESDIKHIIAEGEANAAKGVRTFLTPEFQCEIVRCAAELAEFSPFTLFKYVKAHMHINTDTETNNHAAGTCPNCGNGELKYNGGEVEGCDYVYKWACEECGTSGREFYEMTFSEHIIDGEAL